MCDSYFFQFIKNSTNNFPNIVVYHANFSNLKGPRASSQNCKKKSLTSNTIFNLMTTLGVYIFKILYYLFENSVDPDQLASDENKLIRFHTVYHPHDIYPYFLTVFMHIQASS